MALALRPDRIARSARQGGSLAAATSRTGARSFRSWWTSRKTSSTSSAGDREPGLCRLLPPPAELAEDVFLLVHQDLKDLAPVRDVAAAVADLFRREAAALAG